MIVLEESIQHDQPMLNPYFEQMGFPKLLPHPLNDQNLCRGQKYFSNAPKAFCLESIM